MDDDTTITPLHQPGSVEDPLTEIARDGARRMLAAALRAEAEAFVAQHAEEILPDGRQRVVRHGYGPERSIQTGIGALDVRRPKVRDRAEGVPPEKRIRFSSAILPRWARRSKSLDALLPVSSGFLRAIECGRGHDANNRKRRFDGRGGSDRCFQLLHLRGRNEPGPATADQGAVSSGVGAQRRLRRGPLWSRSGHGRRGGGQVADHPVRVAEQGRKLHAIIGPIVGPGERPAYGHLGP